jgi:hypothetical protein
MKIIHCICLFFCAYSSNILVPQDNLLMIVGDGSKVTFVASDSQLTVLGLKKEGKGSLLYYHGFCRVSKAGDSCYLLYKAIRVKKSDTNDHRLKYALMVIGFAREKTFKDFCKWNSAIYEEKNAIWKLDRLRIKKVRNIKKDLPLFPGCINRKIAINACVISLINP